MTELRITKLWNDNGATQFYVEQPFGVGTVAGPFPDRTSAEQARAELEN